MARGRGHQSRQTNSCNNHRLAGGKCTNGSPAGWSVHWQQLHASISWPCFDLSSQLLYCACTPPHAYVATVWWSMSEGFLWPEKCQNSSHLQILLCNYVRSLLTQCPKDLLMQCPKDILMQCSKDTHAMPQGLTHAMPQGYTHATT